MPQFGPGMTPKGSCVKASVPTVAVLGGGRRILGGWGHAVGEDIGALSPFLFVLLLSYHEVSSFLLISHHDGLAHEGQEAMSWKLRNCKSKQTFPLFKLTASGILSQQQKAG